MTLLRRITVAAAIVAVATVGSAGVFTAPAAEATSYRYWTYWLGGSGAWDFSTRGADRVPEDGTVEGWRFAISDAAGSSSQPSIPSSFDAMCADTDPVSGKKRLGLVIDYGTKTDAPPGQSPPSGTVARCLVLPLSASGYDALVAATSIRVADGLICGISGYPSSGCGEPVAKPKPSNVGSDGSSTANLGTAGSTDGEGAVGDRVKATGDGAAAGDKESQAQDDQDATDNGSSGDPANKAGTESSGGASAPQAEITAALETEIVEPSGEGSPTGAIIGLTFLVALAATGIAVARRRR